MTFVNFFIKFVNEILSYKILNFELIQWLLSFSAAIIIFKIIMLLSNSDKKNNKNKKGKGD